jgi:hypothetical protein
MHSAYLIADVDLKVPTSHIKMWLNRWYGEAILTWTKKARANKGNNGLIAVANLDS